MLAWLPGQATNYKTWKSKDNWLSDKSYCTWSGISCFENTTDVLTIYLYDNNLTGTLPDALGYNMTKLTWIDVLSNKIRGTIPASLGELSSLLTLSLGDNELTGAIPKTLGKLTSLESIDLLKNNLSGLIPSEFCDLPVSFFDGGYCVLNDGEGNQFKCPLPACMRDGSEKGMSVCNTTTCS